MSTVLQLSVTALAEFACQSGDLEGIGVVGPSAREGVRAHRALQQRARAANPAIEAEYRVCRDWHGNELTIRLTGRVDLLDRHDRRLTEIKSTLVASDRLSEGARCLHRAQLRLYGYCIAGVLRTLQDGACLELEMLYLNLLDQRESRISETVTIAELEKFADNALARFADWQQRVDERRRELSVSAATLEFPFARFRTGQRDMAAAVYRALRDGDTLLCEAPTGTGKTISSLFPAIKCIGEGHVQQLVYLTAKTTGVESAMASLERLADAGLRVNAVVLRARQRCCFCYTGQVMRTADNRCPMAIGFFDRLHQARLSLLDIGIIDVHRLDEAARLHRLCPFELSLQMLPWVSVVVGDYNYVFDPLVRLARYTESRADTAVLIDEAHNLVERSRSMYSARLDSVALYAAAARCRVQPPLARAFAAVAQQLHRVAAPSADCGVLDEPPAGLLRAVNRVVQMYAESASPRPAAGTDGTVIEGAGTATLFPDDTAYEQFKELCRYSVIADLYGEAHRCLIASEGVGRHRQVTVQLACLDASFALKRQYRLFRASVAFSATLQPPGYYRDALGLPCNTRGLTLDSPFDMDQTLQLVVPYVAVKYHSRRVGLPALVELLHCAVNARKGNYVVFLPSYAYLQQVHTAFTARYPEFDTWCQTVASTAEERTKRLQAIDVPGHRLGFAIVGGVFGESIDYAGDRLIGAIVVGVGLPGVGVLQRLLIEYFRQQGRNGFDHAARYPGFTRVRQSAGRVIRSDTDRGVVILVDERYTEPRYRALFPDYWRTEVVGDMAKLQLRLESFWKM